MAELVQTKLTSLGPEEVVARSVQFFSTENWKPTSQSGRTATFEGKIPIPWFSMVMVVVGFALCVIPGIILYISLIKRLHRFQNLVVAASPSPQGTEVSIRCPREGKKLAKRFLEALPA